MNGPTVIRHGYVHVMYMRGFPLMYVGENWVQACKTIEMEREGVHAIKELHSPSFMP